MPIYQRSSPIGMLTDDTKAQVAAAITETHVEATGAPRYPRDLGVEVVVVEEHVHERRNAHLSAHRTPGEILREAAPFVEFAVPAMVRAVEVAAVVLLVLLVCPPLFILVVVVAVPLVALAALVAIAAAIVAMPCLLMRHLRGRRAHHTSLVLSRLRRLRGAHA